MGKPKKRVHVDDDDLSNLRVPLSRHAAAVESDGDDEDEGTGAKVSPMKGTC